MRGGRGGVEQGVVGQVEWGPRGARAAARSGPPRKRWGAGSKMCKERRGGGWVKTLSREVKGRKRERKRDRRDRQDRPQRRGENTVRGGESAQQSCLCLAAEKGKGLDGWRDKIGTGQAMAR